MAEGFVLNISKEMLQRLDAADKKIVQIGESAEKAMKKINEAFGKKLTGVEDFIKQLNDIQQQLSKKDLKVNVDLALKNGALDNLKKQIEALGITIPVGVTATGTGGGNSAGAVPNGLNEALSRIATTIDAMNKTLASVIKVQPTSFTPQQQGSLSKKANTAAYREQINAIQQVIYAEKEKARVERENDKKAQIAHRERMTQLQQQEREIMRLAKTYRSMPSSINYVGGLIHESKQATTVNQMITAIRNLKNAKKDLDTTDSRYQKNVHELNKEIRRLESELRKLGHQLDNVNKRSRHLFDITGQLGRALSLMFSVSQITQYVSKMVNVRKEMELQQRSLQVLLQNKDKANELWNQTLDLAVKSPFRVKELVTYTKQLAAYRIESDKLFETNKMLADVSAGLGVDMQRLILAFGQVKSASFLRGCLGKGTPIRLYNEDIKEVQNIVVGDVIMGDDNTPRNVKEIIYGKEQMYIVKQDSFGDDYRVNENHILTLKDNITATIVDVYVKDYLKDKERYNGVKISADGNIIDYPIELIKDNIDEYFGFVIDGNKRFLLGDGTITHNTELRQFTEAGIPMLEELSKYFSEIYGKSVSVAEVFDMISKRMVTFTDVEKVFQRMTGAGGVFFNMQEELSQTTAGLISNLQDSIDLMFNEIGKKNQGVINDVIKAARYLVDNWESVGKVMKGALLTLLMYKAATMDISKITKGWGDNVKFLFSELKTNPLEFFQTFKGNIAMTALTAIIALVIKAVREHNKYKRAIEEVNKAHEKFRKSVSDVEIGFSEMFRNGNDNIDEYRDKLQELIGIAKQSYNIEIDFKVNELETIDEVSRKFDDLKEKILSFNQLSLEFSLDFVERDDRGWEWFQDYLGTDLNQLSESQKSISRIFYEMRTNMSSALKEYYKYKKTAKDFVPDEIFESFSSQDLDTETSYDFFKRNVQAINNLLNKVVKSAGYTSSTALQIAIDNDGLSQTKYEDISNILKQYGFKFETQDELIGFINNLIYKYDDYQSKLGEATKELTAFYQTTNDDISLLVAELEKNENLTSDELNKRLSEYIYNAIKNIATTKELDPLVLDEMLSQAEKYYKEQEQFGFELDLLPKIKPVESLDLKAWQKAYNEEVDEILNTLTSKEDKAIFLPLKIRTDLQGVATTQEKQLATINEAIDTAQKELDRIEKQKTNLDAKLKSGEITKKQYDDLYTSNIEKQKKLIEQLTQLRDLLGGDDDKSKGGKDTATQRIKDQISLIRQLYEEYQKLSNEMGATTAKGNVLSRFADYAEELGLNIDDIDFTNLQGIYNALEGLETSAESAGADAMKALTKAMGETFVELELMFYIDERNKFENQIKDMFSDYELSLELDKLDIPQDWAKTFFGVETKSLKEIQKVLNDRQKGIDEANKIDSKALEKYNKEDLTEKEKTIKKALELQIAGYKEESAIISNNEAKIQELIEKEQQERLKTYLYYARKSIGERAKLKLEEYNTLLDIEKTFQEQQDKQKLNEQVKKDAIANVEKEFKEKMDKLEWEEFQKTDTFINLFRDLENASGTMLENTLEKLNEFKKQWTDMPLEDMKQVIEKINELEMALANLSPRDTIKKSKENLNKYIEDNEIKGDYSDAIAKLQKENFEFETQNLELEKVISNLEVYFRLLEEGKQTEADEFYNKYLSEQKPIQGVDDNGNQVKVNLSKQNSLNREQLKLLRNKVQANKDNIANNQELLSDAEKLKNAYLKQAENIGKVQEIVGQLKNGFDSVVEAAAALGADTEDIELFGNMANDIISSTLGMVQLQLQLNAAQVAATGFGAAMNTALGVIGWIVLAVQTIATVISSIAKSKDNKLVKEIEKQQYKIENLQKAYDDLAEKIDEAWSVQQLQEYHRELKSTTEDLITAQEAAIEAQKQRKKSSKVGSDEWKELQDMEAALDDFKRQLEDSEKEILSKITGGIMDDILGATESFVDAWYDAFKETGDGLKGLEDNFNEMLLNFVKRQAVMKVAGRFIDQWNSVLERYVNNDDNLSLGEITSWANMIEQDLPALSSQLETFFKAFDGILGDTQGNLSGLQRGVMEIQESTAQELASYLNSIRYIVMDSNIQLKTLISLSTESANIIDNPMINQLKIIAQQTSAINTLLGSLVKGGHNLGGVGLKVFI